MQIQKIDQNTKIAVSETPESAAFYGASCFIDQALEAIAQKGSFSAALSGGSTPKRMYEHIASSERVSLIDWSKIALFWSDERAVAETHADSNYRMAMQYFGTSPMNQAKIFRMKADAQDIEQAARDYEELIRQHCTNGCFDLVLLGIGQDAHTASLFPHTKGLDVTDRLVCANFVPQMNTWRMTLTFPCINQASRIIVLACGKEKGLPLKNIFHGPKNPHLYPAQLLGSGTGSVLYIIDQAAEAALH